MRARWVPVLGVLAALLLLWASSQAWAETRTTGFRPDRNGFNFNNTFDNDVVPALDIRTGGLCGGMVYAALDYYYARRAVPRQSYRPANGTTLQRYLYGRQVNSILPNATKWAEIGFNPRGARNGDFFNWGLTSEFTNLRRYIDRGQPVPLGMQGVDGTRHQVLAVGYRSDARGRLQEIYVYDPNFRNERVTLRPNARRQQFEYVGKQVPGQPAKNNWRTYFVDKSYRRTSPANVVTPNYPNDGQVREILVQVNTGADDLRGGRDNVNLIVHLRDGRTIVRNNINRGARWLRNYTETASVRVPPTRRSDIAAVEFTTTFGGGLSGENWDTLNIVVKYYTAGNSLAELVQSRRFFRFTGDRKRLKLTVRGRPAPAPRAGEIGVLTVVIKTGGDDLRGNNDNVQATVHFRGGRTQAFPSINQRRRWADNREQTVFLRLARPMARGDIVGLTLTTTFRGGYSGDNWDVDAVTVYPGNVPTGRPYTRRTGRPLKRFTGDSRSLRLSW